jgi:hypothetical protein
MEEHEIPELRGRWYEELSIQNKINVAANSLTTYLDLVVAAMRVHLNHYGRDPKRGYPDVNEWLQKVMNLKAVGCQKCANVWASGIAGKDADSAEEAVVGAHANGWLVEKGRVLCPKCREDK